jgi:hypothetical protein
LEGSRQDGDFPEFGWCTLNHRGNLKVFAVMHEWACPRLLNDVQALPEARPLAVYGDPEGSELLGTIACAKAEHEPSFRHQVEGSSIFGDPHRMGEGENGKYPDADAAGRPTEHPGHDKWGGALPIDRKMILSHPQGIES